MSQTMTTVEVKVAEKVRYHAKPVFVDGVMQDDQYAALTAPIDVSFGGIIVRLPAGAGIILDGHLKGRTQVRLEVACLDGVTRRLDARMEFSFVR